MKLSNISGFDTLDHFVRDKIERYSKETKNLETLFKYMFSESENVMAETTDGYRIKRVTYGQFKERICKAAPTLAELLSGIEQGGLVGLYMSNSIEWIQVFWQILMCGYRPLLMNTRLSDEILEGILAEYKVPAVISDGKIFSVKTIMANDATCPATKEMEARTFGDEVVFMSSGTTEKVKLCAYNGENFFYQICDSANIVEQCPSIAKHYKGELKQLTLLPFYHVFGFIAVYLWFGFFSRTFVFPKDLQPVTIQNTVKKHEVTHIFAVPMVWDKVYRAATKQIRGKGEKTYKKYKRALHMANALGTMGKPFSKLFLREVREGLFGDSICFLISGGGALDTPAFEFYNGIGYHLANGYGMTEIGITSVEKSDKNKILNTASIGAPFGYTEYTCTEEGELLVRGKTRAARIMEGDRVTLTNYEEWFYTKDLVSVRDGKYYHQGRMDDLIIGASGENLNPELIEPLLKVNKCSEVCLIADSEKEPILLASVQGCFSKEVINAVYEEIQLAITNANLDQAIRKVLLTTEPFMGANDFKVSRHKVRKNYLKGKIRLIDRERIGEYMDDILSELEREVAECFAAALDKEIEDVRPSDHFFQDLNGTSLDYFVLLENIKAKYAVEITESAKEHLFTVRDFCEYIKSLK